jgi:hypothetical protein
MLLNNISVPASGGTNFISDGGRRVILVWVLEREAITMATPDIDELKDRVKLMGGYLRGGMSGEPLRAFDETIERVTAGHSYRHLRTMVREFEEWMRGLPREAEAELQSLLAARFPFRTTLASGDDQWRQRIIDRGHIKNAEEYRLVSTRVEAIYSDALQTEELAVLNGLLAAFDSRSNRAR